MNKFSFSRAFLNLFLAAIQDEAKLIYGKCNVSRREVAASKDQKRRDRSCRRVGVSAECRRVYKQQGTLFAVISQVSFPSTKLGTSRPDVNLNLSTYINYIDKFQTLGIKLYDGFCLNSS